MDELLTEKRINFIDLKAQQEKSLAGLNERSQWVLAPGQCLMGPRFADIILDFH